MLMVFFVAARAMLTWSFELVFPEQLDHVSHRTYTPVVAIVAIGAFEEIGMIPTVMVVLGIIVVAMLTQWVPEVVCWLLY